MEASFSSPLSWENLSKSYNLSCTVIACCVIGSFRVTCLGCGTVSARQDLQTRFKAMNPDWSVQVGAVAPDGDVFLEDEQVLQFRVPSCQDCGGILKPEVTFFGDTVSKSTVHLVHDRLAESDAVLVVGSSLQV